MCSQALAHALALSNEAEVLIRASASVVTGQDLNSEGIELKVYVRTKTHVRFPWRICFGRTNSSSAFPPPSAAVTKRLKRALTAAILTVATVKKTPWPSSMMCMPRVFAI